MNAARTVSAGCLRGLWTAFVMTGIAHADVDEAWLARTRLPEGVQPLLVLILDPTDAGGSTQPIAEPFDPLRDYAAGLAVVGRCDPSRVYWRRGPGPAPDCATQLGLELPGATAMTGLHCETARGPLSRQGFFVASRAAQWQGTATAGHWSELSPTSESTVECRSDRGRHGAASGNWFAIDGAAGPWGAQPGVEIDWDRPPLADPYIFYSGRYLNYLRAAPAASQAPIRESVTRFLADALAATDELETALIRVDAAEGDGGYVARAPVPAAIAADELLVAPRGDPNGSAPLAETLAEAAAWLTGGTIQFGDDVRADRAAFDPLAPGRYRSPFAHACRPVTVAYVTAGLASGDDLAATAAAALPRFNELTGGCGADCVPAIGQWIERADLDDDLPGMQSAALRWLTPAPASGLIERSAAPGSVSMQDGPLTVINLVALSLQRDSAVPGNPQLSAAGMMPSADPTHVPGLVYGLTAPFASQRWGGNLFRYGLRAAGTALAPPVVIDRDGEPALDAGTGLPKPSSRSLWSDAPDANLLTGAAAGRLPPADARRIHAELGSNRILDAVNRLAPGNPRLDRAMLGLGAGDPETPGDVVAWYVAERLLGDPGPHPPVVVDYPAVQRQLVFTVTQDGSLQAFDADSGVEAWAWLPRAMLPRLVELMRNEPTTARGHGIDGPLVLHRHDPDGDGRIDRDSGEHLWLMFGLGRSGDRYYALDVSAPDDPRLSWSTALPATAEVESRAEPVVTRLAIAGSGQSAGDWVALLSGGHDPGFDSDGDFLRGHGNALHLVDASTGRMLWTASGDAGGNPDLEVNGLSASASSAARALDLDGDGYLDRAYLVDVAGGLWRFDFESGNAVADVATARRLAELGDGSRRFQATPDAALVRVGDRTRIAIAFGSGWLSRPRDATAVDRFYAIFDDVASTASPVLTEADLHEVTAESGAIPATAPGWFMRLDAHGAGEKVIGPAVTFDHRVRFRTYQPLAVDPAAPCGPPQAIGRMHAVDIRSGRPRATAADSPADEALELAGSGLPVGLSFGFPGRRGAQCADCPARAFGVLGAETFDAGYAGDPVRTSWRKLRPPPASP